jgi:hypothetical protein
MTTIAAPRSAAVSLRHRGAAGGYLHAGAWAAGLSIGWGVLPEAGDGTSEIAAKYAAHQGAAIAQSVLVHGLAAVAVALVAAALVGAGRRLAGYAAYAAAGLASGQLVLEQLAVHSSADTTTAALFNAAQRVDGAKILLFAVAAVAVGRAATGRWPRLLGYSTAAAIAASGVGYLAGAEPLRAAAMLSLPLLLVWLVAAGRSAGRDA